MSSQKRAREPPMRYTTAGPSRIGRGEFSDEEDAQLLGALMKHGPRNIPKLARMVPTRTEYQIKQRISALQKKAQLSLSTLRRDYKDGSFKYEARDKVALDKWLDQLMDLHEKALIDQGSQEELPLRMLAFSMGLIAKYEHHPSPEECGGVDLKNVYEFLENMMLGLPSRNLRNVDARFLIEGLQRISTNLETFDLGRELGFLTCSHAEWFSKRKLLRTYHENSKEEEFSEEAEVLKFLDSDKVNPFQIPKECLKKRKDIS